jgi:hypothetical protein
MIEQIVAEQAAAEKRLRDVQEVKRLSERLRRLVNG